MSGTITQRDNNMHMRMIVTPFLNKLLYMVDDRSRDNLIRWTDDGRSFVVLRHEEFAKEVLPRFFKHANFSSFVRQLNIYGFHKVPHLQQGGLISGAEAVSWEFSNKHFLRGRKDLLKYIRRKKGTLEDVIRQLQSAVNRDSTPDPALPSQPSSFGMATATPTATPTADPSTVYSFLQSFPMSLVGQRFGGIMENWLNGTSTDQLSGFQSSIQSFTQGGGVGLAATGSIDDEYTKLLLDALNSDTAILTPAIDALGHGAQDDALHFGLVTPTSIFTNDLVLAAESIQPTAHYNTKQLDRKFIQTNSWF
ncbi:Heat shock transcription factor [Coemansia aciculifera]|uniref:Heat shock transcription factor n=1 Tax=Coemansia aciculifera TaxID=417176 RepID=A0A9W8IL66_9FUNG|nr:Heat shock transcription factor [Coemansia aciculifera]